MPDPAARELAVCHALGCGHGNCGRLIEWGSGLQYHMVHSTLQARQALTTVPVSSSALALYPMLMQVPGSADSSEDGKPRVPGAENLSSTASQAEVDLGRALVLAASGIIAGRPEPDPGAPKAAPIAFKVLQWLLNLDSPALSQMRASLGFPFHLRGLDQESGDLLVEALFGSSPDVLNLVVQFISDNDFKATVPWANVNMAAVCSLLGWLMSGPCSCSSCWFDCMILDV